GADRSMTPLGVELHMGENRGDTRAFAKAAIDAGADLILGHGPHVLRGMEIYKSKLIVYSLGNFATYTHFSFANPMQLGAIVEVSLNERGDFVQGEIFSTYQYWLKKKDGSRLRVELDLDPQKRAEQEIIKWSQNDFTSTQPFFTGRGVFMKKQVQGVLR
ncbi:MAG: CapA family protein, partial [Bdellovibrio sp.]